MSNRTSKIEMLLTIRRMPVVRVIAILRHKNLLKTSMQCQSCNKAMAEREKKAHIDGVTWVCYNSSCPKKTTISIREGSFFEGFRLSLADLWTLILMWKDNARERIMEYLISMLRAE